MNDIFSGLESEAASNTAARSSKVDAEIARMSQIYQNLIEQHLLQESSFRGKECRVNIQLIPAGNSAVAGAVKVIEGDTRLCNATKRAIAQVRSFPLSEFPEVNAQLKNINLTYKPQL
ncbi:TolA protein [Vibrio maritimus]|uniref:TolA protein n=1 Tax=Vibrio maritimus TaxID=990268 RepID=A0A090RWC5_9VIBR|nr:TolA protein [Vibrio maritimus]